MTKDRYAIAARNVHEGGWSSLYYLISSLPDEFFDSHFSHLFEQEEEDDETTNGEGL